MTTKWLLALLIGGCVLAGPAAAVEQLLPQIPGARNNHDGTIGVRFTTHSEGAVVNELGYYDAGEAGLNRDHVVAIWKPDGTIVAQVTVPAGSAAVFADGWRWTAVPGGAVALEPSTQYICAAAVYNGDGDAWPDATELTPNDWFADLSVTWSAAYGTSIGGAVWGPGSSWSDGHAYGAANLRFTQATAVNPAPAHNEQNVSTGTDLSWIPSADPGVYEQRVYFSTSAADPTLNTAIPIAVLDGTTASIANSELPFALERDREYRWRVDTTQFPNDPNTYAGIEWVFYTEPPVPVILTQPEDTLAAPGANGVFSLSARNPLTGSTDGLSYQWRMVNPGGEDINLVDGAEYSGTATNELTVLAADVADEGEYYCVLDNGTPVSSDAAFLTVKRQIGAWALDDATLADAEGTHPGVYFDASDPNIDSSAALFDPGLVGNALALAKDDRFVRIDGSEEAYEFWPRGMTMSVWMNTDQDSNWQCLVSKQFREATGDWLGWVVDFSPAGQIVFNLRGAGGPTAANDPVNDGQWHLVTATWDAQTTMARVYVDGLLVGEAGPLTGAVRPTTEPMLLGSETAAGSTFYGGLLDEARIFNYAMTSLEVAKLYYTVLPDAEPLCLDGQYPGTDVNGDCSVDLQDVAELLTGWLECNLVPSCIPLQ